MKKQALILFFPLAVFLTETASFLPCTDNASATTTAEESSCTKKPRACSAKPKNSSCQMTGKEPVACPKATDQNKCTAKAEKSRCSKVNTPEQCKSKKGCDRKYPGKDCTDNTGCTTCPVCYTFIFQPQYEWPAPVFAFKKNYSLLNTSYISSYTTSVWKPPNGYTGSI